MKRLVASAAAYSLLCCPIWAVYAPVPAEDQGHPVIVETQAGLRYDSNIFGTNENEQESFVALFAPTVKGQASLGQQTFLQGTYGLELAQYFDRSGDDTLLNHQLGLKLDHTFDPRTFFKVADNLRFIDDPEALIPTEIQRDQSYWSNDATLDYQWGATPKLALGANLNRYDIRYEEAALGEVLDRGDTIVGGEARFALLPEAELVGAVHYGDVSYDTDDALRGSETWRGLLGVDYVPGPKLNLGLRAGLEQRARNDGTDTDAFTGNVSLSYRYLPQSFFALNLSHELRETTMPNLYPESEVDAVYLSGQHDLTGNNRLFLTSLLLYERSTLQVRESYAGVLDDVDEHVLRGGLGLSWRYDETWRVDLNYDLDLIESDEPLREQARHRVSLALAYRFAP
ncbi:MAG: hypothetical protein E1N59_2939 [Puniceicoccaceae bacterium 5H]|nr:MAG: hypothetical protein E1N59_2939 [Puniceicoccaceae bacterium 5H]